MPSRRSSLSVPYSSPPPYSLAGTAPPSFRSSPPSSYRGAEDDSIHQASNVYTSPRKYPEKAKFKPNRLSKPAPLKPIAEKFDPPFAVADGIRPKRNPPASRSIFTCICCPMICINHRTPLCLAAILTIACLLVVAIVLGTVIPIVLK